MPVYEYRCVKCGKRFTLRMSLADYEKGKTKCPRCNSKRLEQQFSSFNVKTDKKS